jgi:hypothetical protein
MADLIRRTVRRAGRILQPILDPDATDRHRREQMIARRLKEAQERLAKTSDQVERLVRRVDAFDRGQAGELRQAIGTLQATTGRQQALGRRLLRAVRHADAREFVRDHAVDRLQRLARGSAPVLVGPWTGEVGFELLYWVPFVRWAVRHFRIDPRRITVMSRGGTSSWYGLDGAQYVEIFDEVDVDTFRGHTSGQQKQRTLRAFDRTLVRRAVRRMGARVGLLHPALMYALYRPYWNGDAGTRWVLQMAAHERIVPPEVPGLDLPGDYVAVRFYFSKCFPDTPDNRRFAVGTIEALAERQDVVVLGSGMRVDDHGELTRVAGRRVHSVAHLMRAGNNLGVQTAVVARARAFLGTYGGFAYLAPLCGVDTVAFYSQRTFFDYHLDFAQGVLGSTDGGTLTVADSGRWPLVHGPHREGDRAASPVP